MYHNLDMECIAFHICVFLLYLYIIYLYIIKNEFKEKFSKDEFIRFKKCM